MPRMQLVPALSADRSSVTIELTMDGTALGHIIFDAPGLDQLIMSLSLHRAHLADEVSPELDPGSLLHLPVEAPAWKVPDTHSGPSGTACLALRHPGLGWLGFLLEHDQAFEISDALKVYVKK